MLVQLRGKMAMKVMTKKPSWAFNPTVEMVPSVFIRILVYLHHSSGVDKSNKMVLL
jgi:hypothetical protein